MKNLRITSVLVLFTCFILFAQIPDVVINEIYYDTDLPGDSTAFTELFGLAGASLDSFYLYGVDNFRAFDIITHTLKDDFLASYEQAKDDEQISALADKTADYFRLMVCHWDAVAVDKGIKSLLAQAEIVSLYSNKYSYKEKRAIVQLAAFELECRPIDLDQSIYRFSAGGPVESPTRMKDAEPAGESKYCLECGKMISRRAKYCPECGTKQV